MRSPRYRARNVFLTIAGLIIGLPADVAAEPLQTSAAHAILIDGETRTVLFEHGADDLMKPASTAKIMTVEVVFNLLKSGKLKLDQMLPISETAWRQGGAPSRGATMFAKPHSEISVDDLLHGLIIDSANDAAIALAEGVAGSQGAFATKMTDRARELGFQHLTFTNAWGDDNPDQKVTPREMALLADHLIQTYPDLYKIYAVRDFLWNKIKQPNRDPLLSMDIGADGLTTGNIDDSGYSLVASAVYTGPLLAPVPADKPLAALKLFRGQTEVFSTPLLTKNAVVQGSLPKRALDAGLEYVGSLFRKYVLHS